MKLVLVFMWALVISFLVPTIMTGCESSSETTTIYPLTPSTTPMYPNTGVVKGHVSYFDNIPASEMKVWFFKQGEDSSYKGVATDNNGDYTLSNVPVGTYEIYTATFRHDSPVALIQLWTTEELLPPDAIVFVNDQQVVTSPTIMVPREITHIYYNDMNHSSLIDIADPSVGIVIIPPSTFCWGPVSKAVSYSVLFRPLNYEPANYEDSIIVTETIITSPMLLPCNYEIIILAFDEKGARVGEGMGWFIVK